jgi:hypothetical protein
MKNYPPLNAVTVWTDSGETWTTNVSAATTEEQAVAYFLGQTFNIGKPSAPTEDYLVRVNAVQFQGPSALS